MTGMFAAIVSAHLLYAIVLNNRRLPGSSWSSLSCSWSCCFAVVPGDACSGGCPSSRPSYSPTLGSAGPGGGPLRARSGARHSREQPGCVVPRSPGRDQESPVHLTTAGNPLLGTGWGVAYSQVSSVHTHFGEGFWQDAYLPHNSLLGVAVFGGFVGIAGIWLVVPVTALLGMRGHQGAMRAPDRAAAMAVVSILPAYGVQCYGDIGFQSFTGCLLLGVAMASAGKLAAWAEASPAKPGSRLRSA